MSETPSQPAPPPRIIGRYALFGEIAAGGMATVHLGRLVGPVGFSKTVAIKRLHPQFSKDPEFVSMFLDEARLASRIQHPNVVSTLDIVAVEDEVFLVMEYVLGESLSKLVRAARRAEARPPPALVATIVSQTLHGLHAAHEAKTERREPLNIVHRDVSPQNVLVGVDGVSRVLDFGVAKAAMRSQSTRDGQMKGKISYMSPEQLNGKEIDRRTDVFAAGIVLWEALVGRRLFDGEDAGEVLAKVLTAEIPPPSVAVTGLPEAMDRVVLKALARSPSERYQTAREFAIDLENALPGVSSRVVAEWVEVHAKDALEQRAQAVADIEARSEDLAALMDVPSSVPVSLRRPGAPQAAPGDEAGSGVSATAVTAAEAPAHSQPSASTSVPSTLSATAAVPAQAPAPPPEPARSRLPWVMGSLVGLAALLGAGVFVQTRILRRAAPPSVLQASPKAASAALSSLPVIRLTELPSESLLGPDAGPGDAGTDGGDGGFDAAARSLAPAAPESPVGAPAHRGRPSSARQKSSAAGGAKAQAAPAHVPKVTSPKPAAAPNLAGAGQASCSPPFIIDKNGIRRLKPECL